MTDIPQLVEMGRRFLQTSGYSALIAENPEQMAAMAERLIAGERSVVWVSEVNGELTGMIGMLLFPHHLSAELTAGEVFWWVDADHRGDGVRLLTRAEQWATDAGAVKIQMIAPVKSTVATLYARRRYTPIETAWQKELVDPRGIEPQSHAFQACAKTTSAKDPLVCR